MSSKGKGVAAVAVVKKKESKSEHFKKFQEIFVSQEKKEEVKNLSKGQKRRLDKKTKVQRKKQFDQYLTEVKDSKKNANNMNLSQMEKDLDNIAT